MDITLWTQNSDYDSKDFGRVTYEQAVDAIRTFPWAAELERQAQLQDDTCPPGVGLNRGRELFHVFATGPTAWTVHVSVKRPGRILGLFPKSNETTQCDITSLDNVMPLLRLFFAGDCEQLVAKVNETLR